MSRLPIRLLAGIRLRLAVLGAVGLMIAGTSGLYAASSPSTTTDYQGATIGSHILATNGNFLTTASSPANSTASDFRYREDHSPAAGNAATLRANANARLGGPPLVSASALAAKATLGANFDGLSDAQNHAIAGFHDTPPDQGLCVGFLGSTKVVIEVVNSIFGIYSTSGTLLNAFSVTSGFNDPNAFSDPRCFYDTSTSSFYMTVISCALCATDTLDDLLVVSRSGHATTYQFDTTVSGTCFGDQPHTGYDSNAVYIATDEFCGPGQTTYSGALLIAISKSQVAAQASVVNAVSFPLLSLGGVPILTLEPAFGNGSGREYLLNSFPYDQFGNNNSIANTLGFWTVKGGQHITTGSGSVTLSGRIITSETYAFPVPAASTGDGSIVPGSPPDDHVISEPFLDPGDSRMLQVQLINDGDAGLQLYASLSSAVNIAGDPSARDGAAWFVLDPQRGKVTKQGYVGVAGAYMLYPSILHTEDGLTAMAFSITSPTMNPSAAYVVGKSGRGFGPVQIAAAGTGPHVSFSDVLFGRPRWGDYSALELDPNRSDIWSGTEYIGPPPGGSDLVDNWGTRIWDLKANQ